MYEVMLSFSVATSGQGGHLEALNSFPAQNG